MFTRPKGFDHEPSSFDSLKFNPINSTGKSSDVKKSGVPEKDSGEIGPKDMNEYSGFPRRLRLGKVLFMTG